MTRARLAVVAGAALAAAAGCGSKSNAPPSVSFRLPSAMAVFHGKTVSNADSIRVYLAVANEGRDDLTLVDATNDVVLPSSVLLRPLAVPFPNRPALLASASLGDGGADVLVGVSAGSSVLQLIQTWVPANTVDADAVTGQAVDLGADVLRIVAMPPDLGEPAKTARLAVVLAGSKLAIVRYRRGGDDVRIEKDTTFGTNGVLVHGLGFEPADLAVVPGDGAHVYAATLDPVGSPAVQGVAEVDVAAPAEPWPVRGLDARAPTRLVAGAVLQERRNDLPVPDDLGAIEPGPGAFTGQPVVKRVYAVLDEASCGVQGRIDCGVVTLDPDKTPGPGDDNIPEDWAGWMPYRAPIAVRGRPLALAVSGPPAVAPTDWTFGTAFMRLVLGTTQTVATTAVGIVASENGTIDFLDLGRFKNASTTFAPVQAFTSAAPPKEGNRIWIEDPATGAGATSTEAAASLIHITPGYALDESWTVSFQPALPGLQNRAAEMGMFVAPDQPWLAIQFGDGTPGDAGRTLSQVARLYHPALGVRVGDIVTFKVDSLKLHGVQCEGLAPPGTPTDLVDSVPHEFETEIAQLLAPDPVLPPSSMSARPGGAVVLKLRTKGPDELEPGAAPGDADPPEWRACWDALLAALSSQGSLKGLQVTVNAGRLLLVGARVGYAGRAELKTEYVLRYKADRADPRDNGLPDYAYQDEDALAALCPLADWDGSLPMPAALDCGGAGCDRDVCERLILARKARRRYHLSEDCHADTTCQAKYAGLTFPIVNDAVLRFTVLHEALTTAPIQGLIRDLTLPISTGSGVVQLAVSAGGPTTQANGAITFDRSTSDPTSGYRFYVSYPGNQIADVSPSLNPVASNTIR
ncbi:MAG TPA: hypothetical protein VIV57_07565 [Anaeromyxobacter sp.]